MPLSEIGFSASNSAANEWCAEAWPAARRQNAHTPVNVPNRIARVLPFALPGPRRHRARRPPTAHLVEHFLPYLPGGITAAGADERARRLASRSAGRRAPARRSRPGAREETPRAPRVKARGRSARAADRPP